MSRRTLYIRQIRELFISPLAFLLTVYAMAMEDFARYLDASTPIPRYYRYAGDTYATIKFEGKKCKSVYENFVVVNMPHSVSRVMLASVWEVLLIFFALLCVLFLCGFIAPGLRARVATGLQSYLLEEIQPRQPIVEDTWIPSRTRP